MTEDLIAQITMLADVLRREHGERAAVIIAVGFPIAGSHDRFASVVRGPCLTARGLLAWASRSVECQIDESDTSLGLSCKEIVK